MKKILVVLLSFIVGVLVTLGVLFFIGILDLESIQDNIVSEKEDDGSEIIKNENKNYVVMITDRGKVCADGCTEKIILDNGDEVDFYADMNQVSLNNKDILVYDENDGYYSIKQVVVYDDIIIIMGGAGVDSSLKMYNFDGNLFKTISRFNDNFGRIFASYLRYNDDELFHVSEEGVLSFVGSKHLQGAVNTYISDSGDTIDLCTQGTNISDEEIVSGIFEFSYLGDYSFSEIKYISTRNTVKDFRNCIGYNN